MRPVERGPSPRLSWSDYNDAGPALRDRLGDYCSYCESPCPTDVEHKLPKHVHPDRECRWENFLLSCKSCNSIKHGQQLAGSGAHPDAALALYLWPDTDNTARAFVYRQDRNDVTVAPGLPRRLAKAAAATLEMTGINRIPGRTPGPTSRDRRWLKRLEAWRIAEDKREDLAKNDTPSLRACIAELAGATGFWSVWRVVFAGDPQMLALIDLVFKGTAPDCFAPVTRVPVKRPNGQL